MLPDGCSYHVNNAIAELGAIPEQDAAFVHLDDAWARPKRCNAQGKAYPTHDFSITTEIVDQCWRVLEDGGWLVIDTDDWFLPRITQYLIEEYGDVSENYEGGGYRRTGNVTMITSDGTPDRRLGSYLTNGGYSVVFAHKGETGRKCWVSARQIADRPTEKHGWHHLKPISPYRKWMEGLLTTGEHVVVPCAGTAPAAIAAEQLWGEEAQYTCIDVEEDAKEAFYSRRESVLDRHKN